MAVILAHHSTYTMEHVPAAHLFAKHLEDKRKEAKAALAAAQDRQKAYADGKRRHITFQLGDAVLLSTKNIKLKYPGTPKLLPKWIGPFHNHK